MYILFTQNVFSALFLLLSFSKFVFSSTSTTECYRFLTFSSYFMFEYIFVIIYKSAFQREITKKLGNPKQPTNPFLEMIKFLLERIAPVHIDTESIRYLSLKMLRFLRVSQSCIQQVNGSQQTSRLSVLVSSVLYTAFVSTACVHSCSDGLLFLLRILLSLYCFTSESSKGYLWDVVFYLRREHR